MLPALRESIFDSRHRWLFWRAWKDKSTQVSLIPALEPVQRDNLAVSRLGAARNYPCVAADDGSNQPDIPGLPTRCPKS